MGIGGIPCGRYASESKGNRVSIATGMLRAVTLTHKVMVLGLNRSDGRTGRTDYWQRRQQDMLISSISVAISASGGVGEGERGEDEEVQEQAKIASHGEWMVSRMGGQLRSIRHHALVYMYDEHGRRRGGKRGRGGRGGGGRGWLDEFGGVDVFGHSSRNATKSVYSTSTRAVLVQRQQHMMRSHDMTGNRGIGVSVANHA